MIPPPFLRRTRRFVGAALLALFVLPVFVPPASLSLSAGLGQVFPDVPSWWMWGRLLALLAGAILLVSTLPTVRLTAFEPARERVESATWGAALACLAAVAHALAYFRLETFGPRGQCVYMVALVVPSLILAATARRAAVAAAPPVPWGPIGLVIATWTALRWLLPLDPYRAADIVDMWRPFATLSALATEGGNFLRESPGHRLPGVNSAPFFFQGLPLLQGLGHAPSLTWLQGAHTVLLAVDALLIGWLATRIVAPGAAVVASVAFLFSPFALLGQLGPLVIAIGPFCLASSLVCAVAWVRSRHPAWLALFGSAAGFALTNPSLVPAVTLLIASVAWHAWRARAVSPVVAATACLSAFAVLVPSLPGPATLRLMVKDYAASTWSWATVESALLGQLSPLPSQWSEPLASPVAAPLGALLSPVATARNALRLQGDVLFEPLAIGLFAIGLVAAVRAIVGGTHRFRLTAALVLLLATLAPGLVSNVDRPSIVRIFGSPVAFSLLAALGFHAWAAHAKSPGRLRVGVAIAIVFSGLLLFEVVGPRILPQSAFGIALRALDRTSAVGAVWLTAERQRAGTTGPSAPRDLLERHYGADWLRRFHPYTDEILRVVPSAPLPIVAVEQLERGGPASGPWDELRSAWWSPGLEQTAAVGERLCHGWPEAEVVVFRDPIGVSRVYAMAFDGRLLASSLPDDRSHAIPCREW